MLAARGSWPKGAATPAILHALLDLRCRVSIGSARHRDPAMAAHRHPTGTILFLNVERGKRKKTQEEGAQTNGNTVPRLRGIERQLPGNPLEPTKPTR